MATCPTCNTPLKRDITGLLRCNICGFNYKPGQTTPLLRGYIPKVKLKPVEEDVADTDQRTFIKRVVERLVPLEGLDSAARVRAFKIQQRFREELTNVFMGRARLDKWFNKTAVKLGLHTLTFMQILYDSLEGLESQEAKNLRTEYAETLKQLQRAYTPT